MNQNNNTKPKLTILSLSVASLLSFSIQTAQASANNVNAIQTKQAESIIAGEQLGKLTPNEAHELREEQNEIIEIERDMREDGSLNASELNELFQKLRYAQDRINTLLRNNISVHPRLDSKKS